MEALIPFIVIGVVLSLIGIGVYFAWVAEKKRRETLQEFATEMGLTFFVDGDSILLERLGRFKLFSQGRGRKMKNLIQGDSGEVNIAIFDYKYTTGSGKNSHTHQQSIAALQSAELNCPSFTMRPENFFDKIGSALGFQDIDFESHPEFSKLFVLQGEDEEALRNYMQPKLLEFFESKTGISVEAQPGMMFFYRPNKRVKPAEVKDLLAQAYEVFGHMVDSEST